MGWTWMQCDREYIVKTELRDWGSNGRTFRVLKRKWSGWNRLWVLCENTIRDDDPDAAPIVIRWIGVLLLQSCPSRGEWGAKFVEDSSGPWCVDAPLSWLPEVTSEAMQGQYAKDWYERVKAYHRSMGTGVVLNKGMTLVTKYAQIVKVISTTPLTVVRNDTEFTLKRKAIDWPATYNVWNQA